MGIPVSDDHAALAQVARTFLTKQESLTAARHALDGEDARPGFWKDMAALGWLGLHVPESHGGSGYGLLELSIVVEELGRQCTPGPFLTTAVVSGAIAAVGGDALRAELLPGLANGELVAGLGVGGTLKLDDTGVLDGAVGAVMAAAGADLLALVVGDDLVLVDPTAAGVTISDRQNLDPTQPCAAVRLEQVTVPAQRIVRGGARPARLLLDVLAAAEAAGGAAACQEMGTEYAKERTAFGRPIGQFQAIKHHCANMFVDEQLSVAAVWDAARAADLADVSPLSARAAAAIALPAFLRAAKTNVQVHGGIGFTWEHDAHLHLRRAAALNAFVGPVDAISADVARLADEQPGRRSTLDLPPEADQYVAEAEEFVARYGELPEAERHRFVVESGYLYPSWPKPYGRGAGPLEQLVLDEALGDLPLHEPLGDPAWTLPIILPTIMVHGTDDQKQRWIRPTMDADMKWCQLFSEPGAGSDLANLSTRAERGDGGWIVTGQKVWTSSGHQAARGFALVRTDPDAAKHRGITAMVVDMKAKGVTVVPLKQITGEQHFNEVFLDEVWVPDEDVVGDVNDGWTVALTTLSHERVSLGEAEATQGEPWATIRPLATSESATIEVGDIVATGIAARAVNLRIAARAVVGAPAGVEGNVTKLIGTGHTQRIAEFGVRLLQDQAVYTDGPGEPVTYQFLLSRASTIAGGTSEILRNVIAERVLGLPRDPKPLETAPKGRS
ncbi:MAG: Acyl-CoA dehydrogenase fadE12 [Acidimicrobiales bacterium]|nr:Acyl-CoA dehydrogenase fadE12 [Acidimicrobiales bacterium]